MSYEFRLPDIGEGVAEGEVVKWFVEEGGTIQEDAPLVSVLTDKANVEIPSPKAGKIAKLHAAVGEKVKVGGLLVTIDTGGDAPMTAAPPPAAGTPAARPVLPATAPAPAASAAPRVSATPSVRRLANELGVDLGSVQGSGPGGRVTEADLRAAAAGPAAGSRAPATPSGPPTPGAAAPAAGPPVPAPPVAPAPSVAGQERVPIRGLRRVISEHMSHSVHTAAHFTYVEEVDATELVRLREKMAKHIEREGVRLSYLPYIVKAVVAGLRAHPWLNATMDDERQEIVLHKEYHIGIATAAPEGLVVPVVKNAESKSVGAIAREIQQLAEKARAGKLTLPELTGGTFTITSLGALGGVLATPILNYPQVGILGVHHIVRRPVYKADGAIGPADLMNLSVSLDHRVIDGIVGAQFLSVVKSYLEDPHLLFAEMA